MVLFHLIVALCLPILSATSQAQRFQSLRPQIENIIRDRNAKVGVSIIGSDGRDTLSFYGSDHFPLQSVFKFHIGLTVLSRVKAGELSLNQIIKIERKDLLPGLYSPLRDKYPDGASLSIAEILKYTISQSDNVGCDVLLKLIGGPEVVDNYFKNNGYKDVCIKINEEVMQNNWELQYNNWTTPKEASRVVYDFYRNEEKLLTEEHHKFIWDIMKGTETGKNRLKGNLPEGTIVAHKTGSSGSNKKGLIAAINDIGIVFLPNGKYFVVSVFVSDAYEDSAVCEKIIADIASLTWKYYSKKYDVKK